MINMREHIKAIRGFRKVLALAVMITVLQPAPVHAASYSGIGFVDGANTDMGVCDLNYSYMEANSVRFTQKTLTMKRGEKTNTRVKLGPSGCTDSYTFRSSNKKVVTVNNSNFAHKF